MPDPSPAYLIAAAVVGGLFALLIVRALRRGRRLFALAVGLMGVGWLCMALMPLFGYPVRHSGSYETALRWLLVVKVWAGLALALLALGIALSMYEAIRRRRKRGLAPGPARGDGRPPAPRPL